MNDSLKWGARVRVGGRTMLRPGFSLVGLEGIVVPSAPNTPQGCLTVAVDWQAGGYTQENGYDTDSLPLFVNVPQEHLEIVTEEEAAAAAQANTRPALSIVKDDTPEPTSAPSLVPSATPDTEMPATPELSTIPLAEETPVAVEPKSSEELPAPETEERPRLRLI